MTFIFIMSTVTMVLAVEADIEWIERQLRNGCFGRSLVVLLS